MSTLERLRLLILVIGLTIPGRQPSINTAYRNSGVKVLEAIQRGAEFLEEKRVDSPRLQAELLLARVLDLPRMRLYLEFERELTDGETERWRELLERRGRRAPLQHVLGSTSFCGLELRVDGRALVPRPETELLAEQGWMYLNAAGRGGGSVEALDFGTGSGCLAVALAVHCPAATVWALDISETALALARENAALHGVSNRVRFVLSRGFSNLDPGLRCDIIISNPPYIPAEEIQSLEPEVRDNDPRVALDGGVDGLDFYRLLALEAGVFLKPGGRLALELGDGQRQAVARLLEQQNWIVERIAEDYTGRPRVLVARAV